MQIRANTPSSDAAGLIEYLGWNVPWENFDTAEEEGVVIT